MIPYITFGNNLLFNVFSLNNFNCRFLYSLKEVILNNLNQCSENKYNIKAFPTSEITKIVLLGTGTPNSDPSCSGCSIVIIVNDIPYILDFGPGLIRQVSALSTEYGGNIEALNCKNFKRAFLTHLHSDHTTGYPDLILTPWVLGRDEPLEVYGPEGTKEMTENILKAYREDISYRLYGMEPANNSGWRVNTYEICSEGEIYRDENVTVEAFPVLHGTWPNAFGFRFKTPDRTIVISGDTAPCEMIEKYSQGADILIHEVYYKKALDKRNEFWKKYHSTNHTSTFELGKLAKRVNPGLVILYHILFWGGSEEDILNEIRQEFDGNIVLGNDLDVF